MYATTMQAARNNATQGQNHSHLASLFFLDVRQRFGVGQVVHSDSQEDVQQDVCALAVRAFISAQNLIMFKRKKRTARIDANVICESGRK
jgi:aspartyl-tRNA synthetase